MSASSVLINSLAELFASHPPFFLEGEFLDECRECVHLGSYAEHLANMTADFIRKG